MSLNAFQKMSVVGVEDGSFQKGIVEKALLAAVLLEGLKIKKVKITKICVDGLDATEKLSRILNKWKFDAVMLAGVSFAGFNIIDPTAIYGKSKKPIVIISRTKPDNKAVKRALQRHFEDWMDRWGVFEKLGEIHEITTLSAQSPVYFEVIGAEAKWAAKFIKAFSVCGRIPEPVRIARLIARGLS